MNLRSALFLLTVLTSVLMAHEVAMSGPAAIPTGSRPSVESFETAKLPAGCLGGDGSEAISTPERFKSGSRSLRWTWSRPGGALSIPAPDGPTSILGTECLAFWLYNESPGEDILRLELIGSGKVLGSCWYVLNFKGWRPLGTPYSQVCPQLGAVDSVRLTAPSSVGRGRLYLDYVDFHCPDTPRPDNQQPWIGRPEILHSATPEKFVYSTHDISQNRPWLPGRKPDREITAEERAGMATIAERCLVGDTARGDRPLLQTTLLPQADPTALDDLEKSLRLHRSPEGILTGTPIVAAPIWGSWKFNNPPDGVILGDLFTRLVRAYLFEKAKGREDMAQRLLAACFDVCDHLLDQGYAEGNNNIAASGFPVSCVLSLRKELADSGRLSPMLLAAAACALTIRGDALMHEDWSRAGYHPRNTDLSPDYSTLLVLTVLLPDEADRLQRLYAYSRTLSSLCDPRLGEPYAWDGTGHHHAMFHTAYTGGVLTRQAYALRGTVFRVSPEAIAVLKRAALAYAFLGGPANTVPPNIPGYAGQPLGVWVPTVVLNVALCDTAESCQGVDPDLAAVYLAMPAARNPDNVDAQRFRALGIEPRPFSGHMTLNGAAIALHRRQDWLVSIAGQFKFRRAYEANGAYIASAFNHYSRNGSVYVVSSGDPPSPWDSGFSLEGWDSRHQPGATGYLGESETQLYARMNNSESPFGGGTDLDGDGIWGMEFVHSSRKTTDNIRFHKSAFCFGDRVTMITTDVGRGPDAGPREQEMEFATTLYQNAFGSGGETDLTGKGIGHFGTAPPRKPPPASPELEPCWVDGRKVTAFPIEETLAVGTPHWLVDNKRTGYYAHSQCPTLRVTRRRQEWNYLWNCWARPGQKLPETPQAKDPRNYFPTTGDFATAWFAHGVNPEVSQCIYTLIPCATPERMERFAREMADPQTAPYAILQHDARAHVLHDRPSRTTGYILFQKGEVAAAGKLREVNRPCSVVIRDHAGGLRLSVASTDLDDWPTADRGKVRLSGDIVLTLDGEWVVRELYAITPRTCHAAHEQGRTTLCIPYTDFMPVIVVLELAQAK